MFARVKRVQLPMSADKERHIRQRNKGVGVPEVGDIDLSRGRFVQLSFPVMISLFAQSLIGVVDTAFLARLGEVELGGTAMASMVYYSLFTIGFGLASGTQILVSHRFGSGRKGEIGHILSQSLHLLLLAALAMIAVGLPLGKWIFSHILSSPNIASAATEYWHYRTFGYIFAFTASVFRSFFVGISDTKVLTYNSIVMSVVNIVLDYALIFGNFGLPALGVKGAAIASVLAEASSILFYVLYVWAKIDWRKFGISFAELRRWDGKVVGNLLHLSYYLMLQALISQSGWAILFFMMESLGERQLAIASIVRSLYSLLLIPGSAFNTAARTTVSQMVGAQLDDSVNWYLQRVIGVSLGTVLVLAGVVFTFPQVPLSIFSDNPELIALAVPALRVVLVAVLVYSVGNIYFAAVGATGATKMVFLIDFVNTLGYIILGAILVYGVRASVAGCFVVEVIYYLSVAMMSYIFIRREHWRKGNWSRIR